SSSTHPINFTITSLRSSVSCDHYKRMVEKAKALIHEGDTYEINISHQLQGDFDGNPLSLFHTMRHHGPVPFAAYLQIDDLSACCASPERFLTKKSQKLISDPIKGTRPRGINPELDDIIATVLRNSVKDQAENLMIVDLVRNDFSRVCQAGSVKVTQLFDIQRFGTVHQMVSRVEGDLSESVATQPEEAIAACFPMGSMTGAPKIRSMKIIDELENYKRGLYSGAIGFLTPEGDFSFNVVIRTAIIRNKKLWYSTGGAITADSDPLSEWNETLVKARALQTEIIS
ncbi:MAG: anthranilate synthase component I family protein, partial [Balneolales bacterium]|nr:anthranilate synthase component I family protein [Balneolales bacterium]